MHYSLFYGTNLILFMLGAYGSFLNRRHFLMMLLCIELMLLAVNLEF